MKLEDLAKIKAQMKDKVSLREGSGNVRVVVGMATCGIASGGSDFTTKNQKPEADNSFGGGSGASAKLEPVAFLIIRGESVKLLPVAPPPATTVDRVIEVVPEVVEKVTDFLEKQKKADEPPEGTDHFVV